MPNARPLSEHGIALCTTVLLLSAVQYVFKLCRIGSRVPLATAWGRQTKVYESKCLPMALSERRPSSLHRFPTPFSWLFASAVGMVDLLRMAAVACAVGFWTGPLPARCVGRLVFVLANDVDIISRTYR